MNTHYWKKTMLLYTVLFLWLFGFQWDLSQTCKGISLTFQLHRYSLFPPPPLLCHKDAQDGSPWGYGFVRLLGSINKSVLQITLKTFLLFGLMIFSYKKWKSFVLTDWRIELKSRFPPIHLINPTRWKRGGACNHILIILKTGWQRVFRDAWWDHYERDAWSGVATWCVIYY